MVHIGYWVHVATTDMHGGLTGLNRKPIGGGTTGPTLLGIRPAGKGCMMKINHLRALLFVTFAFSGPAMASEPFDPSNASIEQLEGAMSSGRTTSEDLVRFYLDRISRFDKNGPGINALISLNPAALDAARQSDNRRRSGKGVRPLEGIPFIVKDNYDTTVLPTTGGSAALKWSRPNANAVVVQRLLDQGAILIGKANMSELAASYGRLGYSSAGGLTLNPYNTRRDVSGSSSGSAAAVAADFATFALGTDTSGSIRGPASVAGLVGLRPTLGLTSRTGVIPLSLTVDTAGAITRTVDDMAVVLDAIAGVDPADAATALRPPSKGNYRATLRTVGLKGARLGVLTNFRGGNPEVDGTEAGVRDRLTSQGAVLVPVTLPKRYEDLWSLVLGPVGEAEFKPEFNRYLEGVDANGVRSLEDLIRVSESPAVAGSPTPVNPARLESLRQANGSKLIDSPAYISLLTQTIPGLRQELTAVMERDHLDALVFPTMSCPATPRFDQPDPTYLCKSDDVYKASYIASAVGFPEVTVPAAIVSSNMPVGYSFLGLPDQETKLLGMARAFQASAPRLPSPSLR